MSETLQTPQPALSTLPKKPFLKRVFFGLGSDVLLGTLVALLSIMTAFIGYSSRLADNKASSASAEGDRNMLEYNTDWVLAETAVLRDFLYYDWWYLNLDVDPKLADYYRSSFTDELESSTQRLEAGETDNAFDESYYDDIYSVATEYYDLGQEQFDLAAVYETQSDTLQFSSMVFAVSLALAAWASILKNDSPLRPFFSLFSIVIALAGFLVYLSA
jgi:hypothetical protein